MSLRQRLSELAFSFASEVLDAIRGASLEDLLAASTAGGSRTRTTASAAPRGFTAGPAGRRRSGRLPRRSADDIAQVVEKIVGLLHGSPKGLRAEEIREKLGLQAKEVPRPLKEALDSGRLAKTGRKRATTYILKTGGAEAKEAKEAKEASGAGKPRQARARRAPATRGVSERGRSSGARGTGGAGSAGGTSGATDAGGAGAKPIGAAPPTS